MLDTMGTTLGKVNIEVYQTAALFQLNWDISFEAWLCFGLLYSTEIIRFQGICLCFITSISCVIIRKFKISLKH